MRIGIDARLYSESGIGRYIRNLVSNLSEIDGENEYFVFLNSKNFDAEFAKNFTKVKTDISWYSLKEQLQFPKILGKYNLDLMHFPHFNVPIFYRGKFIVTIHDLIHQKFAMKRATTRNLLLYKLKQYGYKKVFSSAIKKSQKIITVSDYVKDQLKDEWRVEDKKIIVTKEGVEENLIKLGKEISEKEAKKVLDKFNIRQPFLFYIGNAHPHKNVEGLIKAFLELRKKYQYLQLVLSGNDHYFWQKVRKDFQNKDIIYTGFISDEELVSLYKTAKVFVLPSFEEGFGIPILESFALGCPVVASDIGALKEVGGDGAIYFNPFPPRHPERSEGSSDLAEKIEKVLNDQKLSKQLIEKGEKKYKQFSWKKLAEDTLKVYSLVK